MSSREPAVSSGGLCSESSPGSVVSEEAYRPRFTMDQQYGSSDLLYMIKLLSLFSSVLRPVGLAAGRAFHLEKPTPMYPDRFCFGRSCHTWSNSEEAAELNQK